MSSIAKKKNSELKNMQERIAEEVLLSTLLLSMFPLALQCFKKLRISSNGNYAYSGNKEEKDVISRGF